MPADTYDSTLGLIVQGTGNNNNSWGDTFNNSMLSPTVRAIAGIAVNTDVSGTVNLDDVTPPAGLREDIDYIQKFTSITSAVTVEVTNKAKTWIFWNATAFFLYVKVNGGTAVQIPAGTLKQVFCDGAGNVYRLDREEVGAFRVSGKAAVGNGELACNGASYLRADYPDLFTAISTTWGAADGIHFNVPDFVTSNRFFRAAGGSLTVGTTQTNQNKAHTHTGSGTTSNVSNDHTHTFSGTTGTESNDHTHGYTGPGGNVHQDGTQSATVYFPPTAATTTGRSASHTHTFSGTTGGISANHTHTYSFTTSSDGGTEARPENAAVLIGIKY
jgi:microcystin-dependent protein